MEIDLGGTGHIRDGQSLDQSLTLFRGFYEQLSNEQKARLRVWLNKLCEVLPVDWLDSFELLSFLGMNENWLLQPLLTVRFRDGDAQKTASVYPPHLKLAVEAWERGEDFTPPHHTY